MLHRVLHRVNRSQRTVHGIAVIAAVEELLQINRNSDVTRAFGPRNPGDYCKYYLVMKVSYICGGGDFEQRVAWLPLLGQ